MSPVRLEGEDEDRRIQNRISDDEGPMRLGAAKALILGTILFQALFPSSADAQAVGGRLLDMAAGTPVVLGRMTLLDAQNQPVTVVTTDTEGRFLLVAPEPGQYWILIEAAFHEGYSDGPISLTGTDTVSLTFEVSPIPVELSELVVEAEGRSPRLEMEGVYDRMENRIGVHFDRERIRARSGRSVSDIVAVLPMVELWPDTTVGLSELRVVFRRRQFERLIPIPGEGRPPPCFPQVFMDGALLATGGIHPGMLNQISLNDMEAIEVYESPAFLPSRFNGQWARCGTIVLWSR